MALEREIFAFENSAGVFTQPRPEPDLPLPVRAAAGLCLREAQPRLAGTS
jgi:hypothetical protein